MKNTNQDPIIIDPNLMTYAYTDESFFSWEIPLSNFKDNDGDELMFSIENNGNIISKPLLRMTIINDKLVISGQLDGRMDEYPYTLVVEDGRGGRAKTDIHLITGIRQTEQTDKSENIIVQNSGNLLIGMGDKGFGRDGDDYLSLAVESLHTEDKISFEAQAKLERERDASLIGAKGNDTYSIEKGQSVYVADYDENNILVFGEGLRKEDMRFIERDGDYFITFKNSRTTVQLNAGDIEESQSAFSKAINEIHFANGDILGRDDFGVLYDITKTKPIYEIQDGNEFNINLELRDGLTGGHSSIGADVKITNVTLDGKPLPNWLSMDDNFEFLSGNNALAGDYILTFETKDANGTVGYFDKYISIKTGDGSGEGGGPGEGGKPENNEIHISPDEKFGKGTDGDDIIYGHDNGGLIHAGQGDDEIYGGSGNDRIFGQEGNNIITGGKGDDYLSGGSGNNMYVFAKGDGDDTVFASKRENSESIDEIVLKDVLPSQISFFGENYDLIIKYSDTDTIRVSGFFTDGGNHLIDKILCLDGEITLDDLRKQPIDIVVTDPKLINNYMHLSWTGPVTVHAADNNNRVTLSGTGDATVIGGNGNDRLIGSAGNNTLTGGKGDDYLMGGLGSDTYIFNTGDGNDTINNYAYNDLETIDTVKFIDITSEQVSFTQNEFDLVINYGSNDSVRITNYFLGNDYKVDRFAFSDVELTSDEVEQSLKSGNKIASFASEALGAIVSDAQEVSSLINAMAMFGGSSDSISTDITVNNSKDTVTAHLLTSSSFMH